MDGNESIILDNTQSRYTPDVGVVPEGKTVLCGVCGAVMDERRNVNGPRGFVMAMAGSKSPHDVFECPHREDDWHSQVIALREAARDTPSAKVAKLMLEEAVEVLTSRETTKDDGFHRPSQMKKFRKQFKDDV